MTFTPRYKYSEDRLLADLKQYVDGTYNEHYADASIQTGEYIIAQDMGMIYFLCNIIKYASRYGKKGNSGRRDLMKICHYGLMALHVHDLSAGGGVNSNKEIDPHETI